MSPEEQLDAIRKIYREDKTFPPMAYCYIKDAIHKALDKIAKFQRDNGISEDDSEFIPDIPGPDLARFLRDLLLAQFGPFAIDVLDAWNITCTKDFGTIVFKLVNSGVLGKSENDTLEDFVDVFDFTETFVLPYKHA